jgi:hypothetical protein
MATYTLIDRGVGLYENQKKPKPYVHDISKCIDIKKASFEEYFTNIKELDETTSIPWREGVIYNKKWEETPILFIVIFKKVLGKSPHTMSSRTWVEFTEFKLITKK